jgi:hypothetical protein
LDDQQKRRKSIQYQLTNQPFIDLTKFNLRESAKSADKYFTDPLLFESLARHASQAGRALGISHNE